MDTVIRAITVYLVLLILFRISGKRTLAQATPFDLVLTLIISEAVQQAMLDGDDSLTNGLLLIVTLIGMDILISFGKQKSETLAKLTEGTALVVVQDGKLAHDVMNKERLSEDEILQAGRGSHGLKKLEDIKYAVLEQSGDVTVVPRKKGA